MNIPGIRDGWPRYALLQSSCLPDLTPSCLYLPRSVNTGQFGIKENFSVLSSAGTGWSWWLSTQITLDFSCKRLNKLISSFGIIPLSNSTMRRNKMGDKVWSACAFLDSCKCPNRFSILVWFQGMDQMLERNGRRETRTTNNEWKLIYQEESYQCFHMCADTIQ